MKKVVFVVAVVVLVGAIAASTLLRSSIVRAGKASPSAHQKSQPMSPCRYSASRPTASRTFRVAFMTSTPTPSPGSHAIR